VRCRRFLRIFFLLIFICPVLSFAGEYVLIEGKDREVCRAYEKNLNSFKHLKNAMVCERKLNPKFPDFKKPEWEKLDVWENRELVRMMDRYLWNRGNEDSNDKDMEKWLERLKERIKNNEITLSLARVDIDNNGTIDNVIQYDMGTCSDTDESSFAIPDGRRFIVFNKGITAINTNLTFFTRAQRFGILTYKGRTYLDSFGGNLKFRNGKLSVYDSVINTNGWTALGAEICIYKYKTK